MNQDHDDRETFVTDHDSGAPLSRRFVLEVVAGPDKGLTLTLPGRTVLVGSGDGMDLRLADSTISRRHAELAVIDDGVRVADVGSKNGTFAGGIRITDAVLPAGSSVTFGKATTVVFRAVDEPIALEERDSFGSLLGKSASMRAMFALLARAAQSRATVLIEGETGTGKEEIARALHEQSPWKDKPFLVVDCGALSPSLVASELFGHKKGAFTGATSDRAGIFEAAKGGTVLLDEIGELPLDLQPALLRVLESRQVRRVGENNSRDVDVRVIAATHRDLAGDVDKAKFRRDLFFRLALIRVRVPPLRERKDDIAVLVERFRKKAGGRAPDAGELLAMKAHAWPGNVRELKNVVERAAALEGRYTLDSDLGGGGGGGGNVGDDDGYGDGAGGAGGAGGQGAIPPGSYREARGQAIAAFERGYVVKLLKDHEGNVSSAARTAGVDRNWLHRLIKRYDIKKHEL